MQQEFYLRAGAQAFGDGSHPTTAGMLALLEGMDPALVTPRTACDMGAGSGILALAIAHRFAGAVIAVERDRQAFETLQENVDASPVRAQIQAVHADGFDHPTIHARAPFDLIAMNILAEPLVQLANSAEQALAQEGVLLISGLLQWQEGPIRQAYEALGLECTARVVIREWVALGFQKP